MKKTIEPTVKTHADKCLCAHCETEERFPSCICSACVNEWLVGSGRDIVAEVFALISHSRPIPWGLKLKNIEHQQAIRRILESEYFDGIDTVEEWRLDHDSYDWEVKA